jgi:hypothetical protein
LLPALEFLLNVGLVLKFNYFNRSDAWLLDSLDSLFQFRYKRNEEKMIALEVLIFAVSALEVWL